MKTLLKKYKYPFIIFLILATVYTVVISWHQGTQKGLRELYPLEKSANKAATNAFIKAQVYSADIATLHPYFDYDSIVMKPLISRMEENMQKGTSLLPKESIEDILWWVFTYTDIHALKVPPREDRSLDYKKLPPIEFAKIHDKVYEMIERFPEGELYFDFERMKKFQFQAYNTLVDFFAGQYMHKYKGKRKEQIINFSKDKKIKKRLKKILKMYPIVKEKYLKYLGKGRDAYNKAVVNYTINMHNIASSLLTREFFANHNTFSKNLCTSNEVNILLEKGGELLTLMDTNKRYKEEIFHFAFDKKKKGVLFTYSDIVKKCPNTLKIKAYSLYNKVYELNKEKYGENK